MNFGEISHFWHHLGFRPRLTVCLTGVFGIILALGYWSLFLEFSQELQNEFDTSLYNYATEVSRGVQLNSGGQANVPYEILLSGDKIFPFPHGDALVKIYRRPFVEIFSFSIDQDAPRDFNFLASIFRATFKMQFIDLVSPSGKPWRGVLIPFKIKNERESKGLYFLVAVPRLSLTKQENKFRSIFIAGQIFIMVLVGLMISVLGRSLLKSLESLTNNLREMPTADLYFQLKVPRGPPEVSILARMLNQLQERVQQSLKAHQEFVAQAAHQLKTPLTIARGHLEQVGEGSSIDHEKIKIAVNEIDLMASTINNLLNLVQIESGFQSYQAQDVNMLDYVVSTINRYDLLAKRKGFKFQIQCEESGLGPRGWGVDTDPYLFSILLGNLIENAIKYATGTVIEVKLVCEAKGIQIVVANAMKERNVSSNPMRLTQKYLRGGGREAGHGLGLYIADKIASILKIQFELKTVDNQFLATIQFQWVPGAQS